MTQTYIQMAAALLFVILLICAAAFVVRRKQNRFGLMSIVSYHSLGPKKGVAAMKIGEEVLILGVSAHDMRLLKTFKADELDLAEGSAPQGRFQRLLKAGMRQHEN